MQLRCRGEHAGVVGQELHAVSGSASAAETAAGAVGIPHGLAVHIASSVRSHVSDVFILVSLSKLLLDIRCFLDPAIIIRLKWLTRRLHDL